ncbi:alpha/beta hydrolase domain-containing protein [Tepidicaulis marinus]|uniref:Alpha/beta hydrolase domain-containing protein n=1 Tax=Tepidicaulis marinus TaxID=1333998 RepID=A0A081BC10_9HYPH|nr:alpha/beta hydrolase [Tepidicaulis marinus]GAK45578.1 alpha/beta hydrolase domain-containing protein [Tepidicaulis marinus]
MSLQRLIVRALMKLPEGVILKMAGGEPVEIDGNIMDPRVQLLAAQGAKQPSMAAMSPAEARETSSAGLAMLDDAPRRGVSILNRTIPGPAGEIPVRIYRPSDKQNEALPGIVYYHMGGWVIGDLETCNHFCSVLADECGAAVMSVDYRLAPEHVFPASIEDALAAYEWAVANGAEIGMDTSKIAVGGDSAGGNMAAVVCQEVKRKGGQQPAAQLLIYPATDPTDKGGSMQSCAECYPLTKEIMDYFLDHALPDKSKESDPRVAPALSDDLSGLAPAIVATAGFDPLRDQGEAYANKLKAAGVDTLYRCYTSLAHAFTAMSGTVPEARRACIELARDLKRHL